MRERRHGLLVISSCADWHIALWGSTGRDTVGLDRDLEEREGKRLSKAGWDPKKLKTGGGALPLIMSTIGPRETHDYRNYSLLVRGINTSQKRPKNNNKPLFGRRTNRQRG